MEELAKESSSANVTKEVWAFNPTVPNRLAARFSITIIGFLLMVIGLFWNLLILIVVTKKRHYKKQPTIVLLINLAVINILVCTLIIPFNIVAGITGEYSFGSSDVVRCRVCKTGAIYSITIFAALTNLALMSVDRLVYIKLALKYATIVTNKRIFIAVLAAWAFSIAISPQL